MTKYLLTHTELGQGLSREDIDYISLASIMHDVGKIAVPDAILNKPGKLTPEEMEEETVKQAGTLELISEAEAEEVLVEE